jgi:hypothetical protein
MSFVKAHLKAIVAFCGFVGAGIASVTSGGIHGVLEWTVVLVALANAVQVYVTPNLEEGAARFAKEISAIVLAVAGVLTPAVVEGGLSAHEWWMVVIAIAGALGVVIVPNVASGRERLHAAKV